MIPNMLQTSPFIVITPDAASKKTIIKNSLLQTEAFVENDTLDILKTCRYPQELTSLNLQYKGGKIQKAFDAGFLVNPATVWDETYITSIEIEAGTQCNWSCRYCPRSIDPKKSTYMSMELFNEIIDKAVRLKTVEYVTLNSYNEPALDKYFESRVQKIAQSGLKLILHSNGSVLDKKKIKLLKDTNVLSIVYFNIPSLDESEFKRLTGSSTYEQTIRNIDMAIESGFNVELSIQGTEDELKRNLPALKAKYEPLTGKSIIAWGTGDRAGILDNCYARGINITEPLYGCSMVLNWIHIGVNGDLFICFNDYYQKNVYGNIKDGEFADILANEKAKQIRKRVYGGENAPNDQMCRKCDEMYKAKCNAQFTTDYRPVFDLSLINQA